MTSPDPNAVVERVRSVNRIEEPEAFLDELCGLLAAAVIATRNEE